MGLNQRLKNMKKQNSKFKVEVIKTHSEKPYAVVEVDSNSVIARCRNREDAMYIMNLQKKTPTFGNQPIPSFFKEPL